MICYFSATGNSRYVAERLAKALDDELFSLNDAIKQHKPGDWNSDKPYVIVCPIYAWRIPRVVEEYLRTARLRGSRDVYFVVTCGQDAGAAASYVALLCQEKGLAFRGLTPIVMPDNYLVMFPVPDQSEIDQKVQAAGPQIDAAAARIRDRQALDAVPAGASGRLKSGPVNQMFYRFFVSSKGFYATDACTGCGKCQTLCPTNAIRMQNGRPVWGSGCTHCMACINRCPVRAIEYKKGTRKKGRYHLD